MLKKLALGILIVVATSFTARGDGQPAGPEFVPAHISYDSDVRSFNITTPELRAPVTLLIVNARADVKLAHLRQANPDSDYACQVQGSSTMISGTTVFALYSLKDCQLAR